MYCHTGMVLLRSVGDQRLTVRPQRVRTLSRQRAFSVEPSRMAVVRRQVARW